MYCITLSINEQSNNDYVQQLGWTPLPACRAGQQPPCLPPHLHLVRDSTRSGNAAASTAHHSPSQFLALCSPDLCRRTSSLHVTGPDSKKQNPLTCSSVSNSNVTFCLTYSVFLSVLLVFKTMKFNYLLFVDKLQNRNA